MAGKIIIKGRAIGVALVSACSDPYFLPISIKITYRSREEARRIDEAILVERNGVRTTQGVSINLVGSCV